MGRIAIAAFSFSLLMLSSPAMIAQCTDSDADGYYYEAGCGTARDCNDASASIHPGALEICNGFDDDCDGSLDEGCDTICDNPERSGAEVMLTDETGSSQALNLVWNGNGYGISWDYTNYDTHLHFAILDSEGSIIIPQEPVCSGGGDCFESSLIWTGNCYGISYTDTRGDGFQKIYSSRFDPSGTKIGSDSRVTNAVLEMSAWSSIVWTGHEYGVAFVSRRLGGSLQDVFFARLDSAGNKIGSDTRISFSNGSPGFPSLAWTGNDYGVAWHDYPVGVGGIYFARIDAAGNKIGPTTRISEDPESAPNDASLIWTGKEYAVCWSGDSAGNYEIYCARLDATGKKIGGDVRVTSDSADSLEPSLAWTGTEYGVAWHDRRNGYMDIYFARLDSYLQKIGSDLRVTYDPSVDWYASLVWTGSRYSMSFLRQQGDVFIGYFTHLECCDDADLDTYTEAPCSGGDCNDNDATVYPGALELCDGTDNNCDGTIDEGFPIPGGTAGLKFDNNKQTINWNVKLEADRYDVVKGDLMALRSSKGDFTASLNSCLEDNSSDEQSIDSIDPSSEQGFYYIVRAQNCHNDGTYNTGQYSQSGDRDSEIEASLNKCP